MLHIISSQEVINKEKDIVKSILSSYTLPWSYCGLSEIAIYQSDFQNAEVYLKKAKSFSGYEFESLLGWRLKKCEDDIKMNAKNFVQK